MRKGQAATENQYLTTSQLAERYQASESTVHHWRHRGYGPTGVKVGKRVLYRLADVEAWEASLAAGGSV